LLAPGPGRKHRRGCIDGRGASRTRRWHSRAHEKSSYEWTRRGASKGQRVLVHIAAAVQTLIWAFVCVFFNLYCIVMWFYLGEVRFILYAGRHWHRSRGISGAGTTLMPAPGPGRKPRMGCIDGRAASRTRPWHSRAEERSSQERTIVWFMHLWMFFIYIVMWFCLGAVPVILWATVYLYCAKFLRVRIQCGYKCEKVSWDTAGSRTFRESRLSETPIVWRNSSVTFARDHRIHISIRARGINVFWFESFWWLTLLFLS